MCGMLAELKASLDRLNARRLFPYNAAPLIRRLGAVLALVGQANR